MSCNRRGAAASSGADDADAHSVAREREQGTTDGDDMDGIAVTGDTKKTKRSRKRTVDVDVETLRPRDVTRVEGVTYLSGVAIAKLSYATLRGCCGPLGLKGFSSKPQAAIIAAIEGMPGTEEAVAGVYEADARFLRGDPDEYDDEIDERDLENITGGGRGSVGALASGSRGKSGGRNSPASTNTKARAINTWLHDELREEFSQLGNQMQRPELDSMRGTQVRKFWHDAAMLYNSSQEGLGVLQRQHPLFEGIDPSKGDRVDGQSMLRIYNSVVSEYNAVSASVSKSGNHSEFEQYVRGRVVALYLHLNIQDDANVLGMVRAELPSGGSAESTHPRETLRYSSSASAPASSSGVGGVKRKHDQAMATAVVDAAKMMSNSGSSEDTTLKWHVMEEKVKLERERFQWEQKRAAAGERRQTLELWDAVGARLEAAYAKVHASVSERERELHENTITQLVRLRHDLLLEIEGGQSPSASAAAGTGRTQGGRGGTE
eukprot:GHVU01186151.1.p1 GENE.GHVU01186151.1~~GHVU01186151.1.p1  ORF type:complete len:491 (+),score=64.11 GHVU01186151.1:1265-2737(+)